MVQEIKYVPVVGTKIKNVLVRKNTMALTQSKAKNLLAVIDNEGTGLPQWDIDFVADMIDDPPAFFSVNQRTQIERIYDERCM